MDERTLRECRAVLEADLRVSGATTLAELRRATEASLESLCDRPHRVAIARDPNSSHRVSVTVEGPLLEAEFSIRFQVLSASPPVAR